MFKNKAKKVKVTSSKKALRKKNSKKEKFVVDFPKTTQEMIRCLFHEVNLDYNIMYLGDNKYSICMEYQDVSFAKAQSDEQFSIFSKWVAYLNSFNENVHVQVVNIGKTILSEKFEQNFLYHVDQYETENERKIAKEFNQLIDNTLQIETKTTESCRYLVLTVKADNIQEAKTSLQNYELKTIEKFNELGSRIERVKSKELFVLLYDYFHKDNFYSKYGESSNIFDLVTEDLSIYDILAPQNLDFSQKNMFISDGKYYRILYLNKITNTANPLFYNKLTTSELDIIVTMNIHPCNKGAITKKVDKIISGLKTERLEKIKRANKNGYDYEAVRDEKLENKLNDYTILKNDLEKNGQNIFTTNMMICIQGNDENELNNKTNKVIELASERLLELEPLQFQQLEGIKNLLPLGHNTLEIKRNLSSESVAANVPFNSKDILYPNAIFYGRNLITNNAVFADRKQTMNGNGCILATSGAGKSFSVKQTIEQIYIRYPNDDVIIIDPQNEYKPLLDALNGQMIEISTTSEVHINPFDLDLNYDENNPVKAKTEYIIAFIESIVEQELSGIEKSVIDRCSTRVFEDYKNSGFLDKSKLPKLNDFYDVLKEQPEPEAKQLSLSLERYVIGSLDIFAKDTNVDIKNRLVCFEISKLSTSLQTTGYLVILDHIMNRLAANRIAGRETWIFIDEFHILLKNSLSAEYVEKIYKIGRKFFALPTIITQNIEDVLKSPQGRTILGNSEFALILKQKALELEMIKGIFSISPSEAEYLTEAPKGQGILRLDKDKVIFQNKVPDDYYIYELNQTSVKKE